MSATARFVERASGSRLWLLVFCIVGLVYALTATYDPRQTNDTVNTAVQAHQIATTGSPALDALGEPHSWLERQLREGRHGTVTDRHPGSVLAGVVAYTVARPLLPPRADVTEFLDVPIWPAALAAALITAAAVATIALVLSRMEDVPSQAVPAIVLVLAFGTSTWSVSANALWPHSVTQLGIALAMLGLSAARPVGAGLGFALAVLARTHTAVIAGAAGVWTGLAQRRWAPFVTIGVLSLLGLAGAVAYGLWVFGGEPSMTVGRGAVADRLTRGSGSGQPWTAAGNISLLLVHPLRGLLPMAPVLIPLLVTLPAAWRRAPSWARALAVGGAGQLVVQGLINVYAGGDGFFGSRVTLEALTATLPLWALAYVAALARARLRVVVHVLGLVSIGAHALGATVLKTGVELPWLFGA